MKSVVLAEKPSVARDIARVLNCGKKLNGALEGNQYVVTWALGHLVTLADPEEYDKKYKEWKIEDLPLMPKKMELVVIKQTAKQYQAVKAQLFRKDVNEIIIATDAGRDRQASGLYRPQPRARHHGKERTFARQSIGAHGKAGKTRASP